MNVFLKRGAFFEIVFPARAAARHSRGGSEMRLCQSFFQKKFGCGRASKSAPKLLFYLGFIRHAVFPRARARRIKWHLKKASTKNVRWIALPLAWKKATAKLKNTQIICFKKNDFCRPQTQSKNHFFEKSKKEGFHCFQPQEPARKIFARSRWLFENQFAVICKKYTWARSLVRKDKIYQKHHQLHYLKKLKKTY